MMIPCLISILSIVLVGRTCAGQDSTAFVATSPESDVSKDRTTIRRIRDRTLARRMQAFPMSDDRLRMIPEMIAMNRRSREAWSEMVAQYAAGWNRRGRPGNERVLELKAAVFDWDRVRERYVPRPVSELVDLERTAAEVRAVIEDLDERLLESLPMMASEDRIESARAIVHRRSVERHWRPVSDPGAGMDLDEVIHGLELVADRDSDPEMQDLLRATLARYRKESGEARAAHARLHDRDLLMRAEEIFDLGPLPRHAVDEAELKRITADRSDRAMEILEQESIMHAINRRYVDELAEFLPAGPADELVRTWQATLGGAHVEDEDRLRSIVARIIEDGALEERAGEAILAVPGELRSGNVLVDEEILEARTVVDALMSREDGPARDAALLQARGELLELLVKRRKRMIVGIQTIRGIMGGDAPDLDGMVVSFESELQARVDADLQLMRRSRDRADGMLAALERIEEERRIREATEAQVEESVDGETDNPDDLSSTGRAGR